MKLFTNPFKMKICHKCGKRYELREPSCPYCNEKNETYGPQYRSFEELAKISWGKELAFFLVGWVGLAILANIIGLIILTIAKGSLIEAGLTGASLAAGLESYRSSALFNAWLNNATYLTMFIMMLLILGKNSVDMLGVFRKGRTYYGFLIGVLVFVLTILWGMISSRLGATTNTNQKAVQSTILLAPALSAIVTGMIGPFVEEITYRVGLFAFLKRINRFLAYLAVGVLFGLIHMKDFASLNEWLSYPSYLIAGLAFCFAYEKFGFGAAFIAHSFNNLVSVLLIILTSKGA